MPSIVHKNSAFATSGIVLTSEDVQEQGNGLVNASLNFVIDPAKERNFIFSLDSAPPIYPRGIDPASLQNQALFMVDRSISRQNGLLYVKANYAGALNIPTRNEFRTDEYETIAMSFRIFAGYSDEPNGTGGIIRESVYDTYVVAYRRRIISYEVATLDGLSVTRRPTPDPLSLIVAANYVSRKFGSTPFLNRTFFPPANAFRLLREQAEFLTNIEEKTKFVTPTVKVYTISFVPEGTPLQTK